MVQNQVIYLPCGNRGGNGTKTYDSMTPEERKRIYDFVSFVYIIKLIMIRVILQML